MSGLSCATHSSEEYPDTRATAQAVFAVWLGCSGRGRRADLLDTAGCTSGRTSRICAIDARFDGDDWSDCLWPHGRDARTGTPLCLGRRARRSDVPFECHAQRRDNGLVAGKCRYVGRAPRFCRSSPKSTLLLGSRCAARRRRYPLHGAARVRPSAMTYMRRALMLVAILLFACTRDRTPPEARRERAEPSAPAIISDPMTLAAALGVPAESLRAAGEERYSRQSYDSAQKIWRVEVAAGAGGGRFCRGGARTHVARTRGLAARRLRRGSSRG